jgi:hypothetical protein
VTQAGSQVTSLGDDLTVQAKECYTQTASNMLAPGGESPAPASWPTVTSAGRKVKVGYDCRDEHRHLARRLTLGEGLFP